MLLDILHSAILCIFMGAVSIPVCFSNVTTNPVIVWVGNALGSIFSAAVVIYIGNRITNEKFKKKVSKRRIGKKVVTAFDDTEDSKKVVKARDFINKHSLKLFSLLCPIFPGVLISTAVVFALDLDKQIYKRWMFAGVFLTSGGYVLSYWWVFVKT